MGKNKVSTEIAKKRGENLKKAREARNLSQNQLADLIGYTPQNISKYENGKSIITSDVAEKFAEKLNVSDRFIMGKTQDMFFSELPESILPTPEEFIVRYLLSSGHNISFFAIRLFDGKQPQKKYVPFLDKYVDDWESLEVELPISKIKDFSFDSDIHLCIDGEIESEIAIVSVIVDGYKLSWGHFIFYITQLQNAIKYQTLNIKYYFDCFAECSAIDSVVDDTIKECRSDGNKIKLFHDKIREQSKESVSPITVTDDMENWLK